MRLIDADALKHHVNEPSIYDINRPDVLSLIDDEQSVDAEPVRYGRWISVKNQNWPAYSHDKCSICGWWNTKNAMCYEGSKKPGHSLNYCPNCGAKMDLEENE